MTPSQPKPPRKTSSQKMAAIAMKPSAMRLRAGMVCVIAFALAVLLLTFIPHPPGEKHEPMEFVAVISLGIVALALLAPETLEGISKIIRSVGEAAAKLKPGRKP